MVLYHKEILQLIDERKKFWDPFVVDPGDESGSQKQLRKYLKGLNIFGVFMVCLGTAYISYCVCLLMPPIEYWLPDRYLFLSKIIMITEIMWFAYASISVFAFNALFVGFCVNMCIQYRLISYRLLNMAKFFNETNQMKREIKMIVDHHIFILE